MKSIKVTIQQIDKKGRRLSLFNLKDQIGNVLYRDTIVSSAKLDQLFYILVYFAALRGESSSVAEIVLDHSIPRLRELNRDFRSLNRRLHGGEYTQLKNDAGLDLIFRYDLFFVLYEAIEVLPELRARYGAFLESQPQLRSTIQIIEERYRTELIDLMRIFMSHEIEDERVDENGNVLDHSKSVYRTVGMRSAKNLNLNLQKYTDVRSLRSESPIDLTIIQYINPQMIFDLWEKYHIAEYAWYFMQDMGQRIRLPDHIELSPEIGLGELLAIHFARENSKIKAQREELTGQLARAKRNPSASEALEGMTEGATNSVLNAAQHLTAVISQHRRRLRRLESQSVELQNKEEIENLKEQIEELENLRVEAELLEGD